MRFWVRALLGLSFIATLWGSFSPGWGWLAWLAPAFFYLAVQGTGIRGGLVWGGSLGVLFFALELQPLFALRPFLGPMAMLPWFALALYGGLFFAGLGAVVGWRKNALVWAGAWALLEAARGAGPLGFSFGALPQTLVGTPFLSAAAWGGPALLSLAIAWTGAALTQGLRRPRFVLTALLGPGTLALLAFLPLPSQPAGELTVALVQPGFSQLEKLERDNLPVLLERYRELLSQVPAEAELVAVPENVLPGFLLEETELMAPFQETARRLSVPVLVGTGTRQASRVYNSVLLLSPEGTPEDVYHKRRLVPFGEYLPGREIWRRLGLEPLLLRYLPYDLAFGPSSQPLGNLGVMICFESLFPGLSRELVLKGAEALFVLTNDAWFGET
ncbi:MAG TPA: apolipoprotein N-acyltransferase, partial [Candidatus Acetothermia bacterium]|nr:apolipoprotein N-acyltransferase [Candidatus Acetothermia bacterium]